MRCMGCQHNVNSECTHRHAVSGTQGGVWHRKSGCALRSDGTISKQWLALGKQERDSFGPLHGDTRLTHTICLKFL